MSVVVYGPQRCGKTQNAEKLREFFKCDKIVDTGRYPYPKSKQQDVKFKAGNDLILTHENPPRRVERSDLRRIVSYEVAMELASK